MKIILDIGAGKFNNELIVPDEKDSILVVHVDRCYPEPFGKSVTDTALSVLSYINGETKTSPSYIYNIFCKSDVFEFLDNFPIKCFDKVICNRMFEHLEYCNGEVGRMLEACNAITKYKAEMEFVVPNAEVLAEMVLKEGELTDNDVMIINTEFCNGKFDPHASVWTPRLAKKYIDQEDTWRITGIVPRYPFAGRNIYMKVFCEKPQEKQHRPNYSFDVVTEI